MPPEPFDLHAFNPLPRPDIEAALRAGTPESLGLIFPYLFKPNRALAWADDAARFPLTHSNLRWLFRLPLPPALKWPMLAVVGTDGVFSLWRYALVKPNAPAAGGGLYPLRLIPDCVGAAAETQFLHLNRTGSTDDRAWGFFYLERALCTGDREGGVRIRLLTPSGEHHINLDLGSADHGNPAGVAPIRYSHQLRPAPDPGLHDLRQIGGWDGGDAFYWNTSAEPPAGGHLFSGSRYDRQRYQLDAHRPGLPLRAAAATSDWVAVGGDDERLWIGRRDAPQLNRSPNNRRLRGYVRSLAMVSRGDADTSFVLVGCDDHCLHILDQDHKSQQKVDLGGVPEAILPLDQAPDGTWYDLAVLVRDRGLMCVRLLRDRFRPDDQRNQDKNERDALLDLLEERAKANPNRLRDWLDAANSRKQLLGLGLLLHRPGGIWYDLNLNDDLPLGNLRQEVIDYIAHTIKHLMEPLALGQVTGHERACSQYLSLLKHFAEGPYRTRLAVRRLEGWLSTLRAPVKATSELSKSVDHLIETLPDAKRLLRTHAAKVAELLQAGQSTPADAALGQLVALTERLRFRRLFNEIILAPVQTSGRVDAVTIVRNHEGRGLQVFGRRGEPNLESFRNDFSTKRIRPIETTRDWPRIAGPDGGVSDIRALLPLGQDLLLVVCEDQVGVIPSPNAVPCALPQYRRLLDTAGERPFTGLHSAAVRIKASGGYRVAIGVEWLPRARGPVILLDLDAEGHLLPQGQRHLPAPTAWQRRVRVNALAWDHQGRLWGATGGPGYLLNWQATPEGAWRAHEVLAVGSPQYALQVIGDEQILSGGEDGVLRSCDNQGRLDWARILPGAVIGIGIRRRSLPSEQHFAPIAVITERDTVTLYDRVGRHLGILDLPGDHLTALASGPVADAKVQHHLVGTLRGDARLLEEVPAEYSEDPLLFVSAQFADSEHKDYWYAVQTQVRQAIQTLEDDLGLCHRWTETEAAIQEPLRACWAARRLIGAGDFDSVLHLLEQFRTRHDPQARELRAHVFGSLGEAMTRLPTRLDDRFIDLCRDTLDGALASLLTHTPADLKPDDPLQKIRDDLWQKVLSVARDKVWRGYPFVSSAVLQRLQLSPLGYVCLGDWLTLVLEETVQGTRTLHPGFAQGLMGIVLHQIGYGEDGVLTAFARPAEAGVELVEFLRAHSKAQGALLALLDRYSGVLLRAVDHSAWRTVAAGLRADPDTLFEQLGAAVEKAIAGGQTAPDLTMLRRHLALFPKGVPAGDTQWRTDALTKLRQVTDELRGQLHRVHTLGISVDQSLEQLEALERLITRECSPSPLVVHIHAAWQRQWQQEVRRERDRITRLQAVERYWPEAPEPVHQVFRVMHDAGFQHGRYYRVHYLPGCGSPPFQDCIGLLELKNYAGGDPPAPEYPRRYRLDGELAQRISQYQRPDKPRPDELVCKQQPADSPDPLDAGLRYWQEFWRQRVPVAVFEIPVIRYTEEEDAYRSVGLFVFDMPAQWEQTLARADAAERLTPSTRDALRLALNNVIDDLKADEQSDDIKTAKRFDRLEKEMLSLYGSDAMQQALLRTAVEVAGAEDGLLVVRSTVTGLISVRGATAASQELFAGVRLRPEDHLIPAVRVLATHQPLLIPWFDAYPHAEAIRKQLEQRFTAAGKPGRAREWLGKFGSTLVLPVKVGGEPICAISLRHARPYAFFAHHLRAAQTLLNRYRWYFKVLQVNEERRHSINAFVHELRSDLLLVKQPLELLRRHPERAERLFDTAERQVRKIFDLTENFLDIGRPFAVSPATSTFSDPGAILSDILRQYGASSRNLRPAFHLEPADLSSPVWRVDLRGQQTGFERVIRNLIDNAVKYGREDVRVAATVSGRDWRLLISNPGQMTPEEDALKFQPFIKPAAPRFDGSHVGLAASLGLARAIGGNLELENQDNQEAVPRVVAVLTWPSCQLAHNDA